MVTSGPPLGSTHLHHAMCRGEARLRTEHCSRLWIQALTLCLLAGMCAGDDLSVHSTARHPLALPLWAKPKTALDTLSATQTVGESSLTAGDENGGMDDRVSPLGITSRQARMQRRLKGRKRPKLAGQKESLKVGGMSLSGVESSSATRMASEVEPTLKEQSTLPGTGVEAGLDPGNVLLSQKVTKATLHMSHRTSSLVGIRNPQAGQRCAIYVLDLNKLAAQHGLPQCNLDDVVSDKITQVPFLRSFAEANKYGMAPHYFTANAGPWFLYELLSKRGMAVDDPNDADIIYVHDYCYKMWWLASVHSRQTAEVEQEPGKALLSIYAKMMEDPLWTKYGGRNFVFFQSHTGFARFETGNKYEDLLCAAFAKSHHFVNTRANRYRCPIYNEADFTLVMPAIHFNDLIAYRVTEKAMLKNATTKEERFKIRSRDLLLFFRGKCTPVTWEWGEHKPNRGKTIRRDVMRLLAKAGPDVRIECTGDKNELKEEHAKQITHDEQVRLYFKSTFCLVISGDSQTSRRLPEAIMTGCIPVFFGPPFHTMPLADQLDYRSFALFFNLTDPQPWNVNQTVRWTLDMKERSYSGPTDSAFWVPDVPNILDYAINVPTMMDLVRHLRGMDEVTIRALQQGVKAVRSKFMYMPMPGRPGLTSATASQLLVKEMCKRAERLGLEMAATPATKS